MDVNFGENIVQPSAEVATKIQTLGGGSWPPLRLELGTGKLGHVPPSPPALRTKPDSVQCWTYTYMLRELGPSRPQRELSLAERERAREKHK